MEVNDKEITQDEIDMLLLIDKIIAMVKEKQAIENIGDDGVVLLKDLEQTKKVVNEVIEKRILLYMDLEDPLLEDEQRNKLMEGLLLARSFEKSRKDSHTVLQNMYYRLLHENDDTPEA